VEVDSWLGRLSTALHRLQRSPGGTAARHAARAIRKKEKDAIRKVQIQSIKMAIDNEKKANALKEQVIRDNYARQFRELERHDKYASALHRIVQNSWWHGMYSQAVKAAQAKCATLTGDAYALCTQHVEQNQDWLAHNLRGQDKPFQAQYKHLTEGHAKDRAHYLSKKQDLVTAYRSDMDNQREHEEESAAQHEMEVEKEAERRMMVHGGRDLGGDLEDQVGLDKEDQEDEAENHTTADEEGVNGQ